MPNAWITHVKKTMRTMKSKGTYKKGMGLKQVIKEAKKSWKKVKKGGAEEEEPMKVEEGAVAAPTAGLHFSKHLLKKLEIKGVGFAEVTLHVGLGTFNPVEVEDLSKHKMDSEELKISQEACDIVNAAKVAKKRICAVGTTSMRAIESSVSSQRTLNPFDGWTNKFIFPPHDFSIANCMITNFHTPKSTLLMMISAFCGHDLMKEAYEIAVKENYKFYSYGDAMLII